MSFKIVHSLLFWRFSDEFGGEGVEYKRDVSEECMDKLDPCISEKFFIIQALQILLS